MDKIILNLGDREFASGLTYTALSRAKKFENIAFEPDDFPTLDRIMRILNKDIFKERLLEEKRLSKLQLKKRKRKS